MQRLRRMVLALSLGVLSVACAEDEQAATALAVVVKHDLGQELSSVWIRVFDASADPRSAAPLNEFSPQPVGELGRPTVISSPKRTEFLIAVQGLGPGGKADPLVEQHVRVRVVRGKTIATPIFLSRACVKKACSEAGQTCNGQVAGSPCDGTCAPAPTIEAAGVIDDEDDPLPTGSWQRPDCRMDTPTPAADGGCDGGACCDSGMCSCDGGSCATDGGGECKPSFVGSTCNLVSQCGCGMGEACYTRLDMMTKVVSECSPAGNLREGLRCSDELECGRGLGCINQTCRRYCEKESDCGANSTCGSLAFGTGDASIKSASACFERCTSNAGCATGCCSDNVCKPSNECRDAGPAPMMCPAATNDDACTTCGKGRCCTQINACRASSACQAYITCTDACTTEACRTTCAQNNAAGASLLQGLATCLESSCASSCASN